MAYIIVVNLEERTYSVCDGVPSVEKTHDISEDTVNQWLSRNKKNYDKKNILILRAKEKNKVYHIDEKLESVRKANVIDEQ